jgi:small ligand-binding sensory domain FIST
VLAIDGEPAWSVFRSYLDGDPDELRPLDLVHLCVAERIETKEGADAAAAEYGDMVIRTPLTVDKRRGSLFFPGGLREGTTVQLARRDAQRIHDSVIACGDELAARRPGQTPALVLQYDCTGRGRLVFGNRTSEKIVAPLRRALGHSAPWMGFHTYGEIAPLAAQTYYHNYTVVLCALYAQA